MDDGQAIAALSALGQPTRFAIFRLLVKAGPDGIIASEIAEQVGAPRNTVSPHFKILVESGLIVAEKRQRTIVYRSVIDQLANVCAFLLEDCCQGHPENCAPTFENIMGRV